nr:unnamed protein product [Spirometra erinaceieuropaei]
MLGHSPTPAAHVDNDRLNTERPPLHPRAAELKSEKPSQRKGGILSVILPIYALGIFVYFAYIMFKLFGNKNQTVPSKKEKYLKDYYRNFRYNVEKEKFMMDSDSSDDDNLLLRESFCGKTRRSHTRSVNPRNAFDWSRAYGENEGELGMSPDIYRSAKSLPRDLEYLLKKVDDNNLDDAEIHRLRVRLEEVEQEMTRLLEVVNSAALPEDSVAAKPPCPNHRYHHPHQREEKARDGSECIEKTDDDEELLSASEGEGENHEVHQS